MVATFMHSSAFYSLVCLVLVLVGCSSEPTTPIIKGGADAEILNLTDSTVYLRSSQNPYQKLTGIPPEVDLTIAVDSNGIFMQSYDFPEGYYTFEYDERSFDFFIQKDKKLSFDLNAKTPMVQPEFSGKLKYESRYLWTKFLTVADFEASLLNYMSTTPSNYLAALTHYKSKLDTALVTYITNHPTGSKQFMQQESLHNYYFMAKYITLYQSHLAEQNFNDSIIDSLEQQYHVNVNDTNAFNLNVYYDFIEMMAANQQKAPSDTANLSHYLQWMDTTFTQAVPHDYLLAQLSQSVSKWEPSAERIHALDTILYSLHNSDIRNNVSSIITADTTPQPDSTLTTTL